MDKQKKLEHFVRNEVIMNASMLIEDLLSEEGGLISFDDIENLWFYVCPECGDEVRLNALKVAGEDIHACIACDFNTNDTTDLDMDQPEVFEWWFVTQSLYEDLKQASEVVINTNYGYVWGRTTTGQAIVLDNVIEKIYDKLI